MVYTGANAFHYRALQYCVIPSGMAHCCAMNTSMLSQYPELLMSALLAESDNSSLKRKLIQWTSTVVGSPHQRKVCSIGGQQAIREREYEVGFQEKAFWQWDLEQEVHAIGTQTTWKFLICFWMSNQQKLLLGREWKWSTWHSEETPHLGKWMPQEICTPYLCFSACRENPVSSTSATSSFDNFWILFGLFLMPRLHSGKERAQPGCYVGNQLGHKWDLYFAFSLCLRSDSIFTIKCPVVS